jgi:hypothetical protein
VRDRVNTVFAMVSSVACRIAPGAADRSVDGPYLSSFLFRFCTNVHKLASVVAILVLLAFTDDAQTSRKALQLRLWALFMFFFIPGLLMASWATRTPAIRDILCYLRRKWASCCLACR